MPTQPIFDLSPDQNLDVTHHTGMGADATFEFVSRSSGGTDREMSETLEAVGRKSGLDEEDEVEDDDVEDDDDLDEDEDVADDDLEDDDEEDDDDLEDEDDLEDDEDDEDDEDEDDEDEDEDDEEEDKPLRSKK